MADTKPDSRQIKKRSALPRLGTAANATVEAILDKVNVDANYPLRLAASDTPDARLNFSSSSVVSADSANEIVSPVKKQIFPSLSSPWINFQTQAVSNAADFDIVFPVTNTVGRFRQAGFTLISSGKIKVLFSDEALTEGALPNAGALFVSGGLPIGYVVLECTSTSGYFKTAGSASSIIENAKIFRFGSGAGGGSGTGDANTFTENLKHRLTSSYYEFVTPVVFESDEQTRTASATATFDIVDGVYRFNNAAENFVSIQMFDTEFLANDDDSRQVELHAEWFDSASRDDSATYQVALDGTNYETVTMTRQGLSQKFTGSKLLAVPSIVTVLSQASTDTNTELDASSLQALSAPFTLSAKNAISQLAIEIDELGTPVGSYIVSICKDNSGVPGDVIFSKIALVSTLNSGLNVITLNSFRNVLVAGNYHIKIETDATYKAGFSAGVNSIRLKTNSGGNDLVYNGTTWSAGTVDLKYALSGHAYDLRVQVASSAGSKKLKAFGIFYDEQVGDAIDGIDATQTFTFSGNLNTTTFLVTNFLPTQEKLKVYDIKTGQVYRYPAFQINGNTITFDSGTFLVPGETVQLIFDQSEGAAIASSVVVTGTGGGAGDLDTLLSQTFDSSALGDFTQTGLELVANNTINGTQTARLVHQAASSRSFKQILSVDRKYRSELMQLSLQVRSSASNGNLTLLVTDETNAVTIAASQQIATGSQTIASLVTNATTTVSGFSNSVINSLSVGMSVTGSGIPTGTLINAINTTALTITLSQAATASATVSLNFSSLPDRRTFSFAIPANCASMSYTITALQEANSPESYIDDIVIQLAQTALLSTSVEVPVIETQTSRISQTASFGNADITGALTTSTGSGVYSYNSGTGVYTVLKNAQFDISATFRANGAASVQPLISDSSGSVEYATDTSLASAAARANASGSFYLTAGSTFKIRNALAGTTNEQYISVNAVYTSSTAKTIPLTQSGLVQEADSLLRLGTANGYGSTFTVGRRFSTIVQSKGDGFVYEDSPTLGTTITITKDGFYSFSYTDAFSGSAQLGLSLNYAVNGAPSALPTVNRLASSYTNTNVFAENVSWSGPLVAGDVVRPITDGVANNGICIFNVSRVGVAKQLAVSSDQKITIPTSELRFEGASSRGAVATAIVKFDTLAKIRGDAFTVTNTANDGTFITMSKKGKLSGSVSLQRASTAIYITLSKNQANLTTTPLTSEILAASGDSAAATASHNIAGTWDVEVGDVIRVSATASPTADTFNLMTLAFQEQEIAVSVTNTLPQFSESDSSVRVDTANGYGSTATKIRRFSNIRDNIGTDIEYADSATNGASFTVKSAGIYSVSYGEQFSAAGIDFGISKNASSLTTNISSLTQTEILSLSNNAVVSGRSECTWVGYLAEGDIIRPHSEGSAAGNNNFIRFTISKVGKPNVTGVNVTPFINVPQPTSSSISLSGGSRSGAGVITNYVLDSSFGSNLTYSAGNITAQKTGTVTITASGEYSSGATGVAIYIDGVFYGQDRSSTSSTPSFSASATAYVTAGQVITIQNASSGVLTSSRVQVTLLCNSDQILTAPETFSTDTASLTYAGSAQYTLSTLADAPVGTFITWTVSGVGVPTQTNAAPPAQTTSDMNVNGFRIFTRGHGVASTSGNPAKIAINIGKGYKGHKLGLFKSAGKLIDGDPETFTWIPSANTQLGIFYKTYNPQTGVLSVDLQAITSTATSAVLAFSDGTNSTDGYLVINASKSPALTGVPELQPRIATISDVKAATTDGGTFTAGAWQTRTLNTITDPTSVVVSLSSNQFILPAGQYFIYATAPASSSVSTIVNHKAKLRNITDSTDAIIGTTERLLAPSGSAIGNSSRIVGTVTLTSSKTFEIQHQCATTGATTGFGTASGFSVSEVYTVVQITRIK